MNKIVKEFKDFAIKGNMIDMAVGIIIGGAFGRIITSLVNDVIMPPIGWLVGNVNFSDLAVTLRDAYTNEAGETVEAVTLNYGNFIQVCFDFLIVALCIFFFIRLINRLKNGVSKKEEEPAAPAPEPEPTKEEQLLAEIRDLLKNKE